MDRREFLLASGIVALHAGGRALRPGVSEIFQPAKTDFTLHIAPVSVELAPGKVVKATGYNGTVPGPILRMREGVPVTVDVFNDTDAEELVHWHGLKIPSDVDGAAEEGTPSVPAHGHRRYTFTPTPAGTRWYHTHNAAGANLAAGMYSGQFGFLYIEPKSEPANYDREVFLAIHQWEPPQRCTWGRRTMALKSHTSTRVSMTKYWGMESPFEFAPASACSSAF